MDLYSEILTAMLLIRENWKESKGLQKRQGKSDQFCSCVRGYCAASFKMTADMEKCSWDNVE